MAERQVNLTALSLVDWDNTRHPGNVTENEAAMFNDVIHDWRPTCLVCNVDITDMILPSAAKHLTLTYHVKALKAAIV